MDNDDRGLAALPKLVGAPAYSRPPSLGVTRAERPPDPDDLPLVNHRTPEDVELARELGLDDGRIAIAAGVAGAGTQPGHAAGNGATAGGGPGDGTSPRHGIGGLLRGRRGRTDAA